MEIPVSAFPYLHKLPIQLRFGDIDMFGHVNNNIYMQYMDLGKSMYINSVLDGLFDVRHHAMVIVNISCQFYQPTYYNETIEVLTRVDNIGQKSVIFEQRVVNPTTQSVKCIARTVMTGFDVAARAAMDIPADWRKAISDFEKREI